jgi:hypothetical protein
LGEDSRERLQELASPDVGGREEQQRGQEQVPLTPRIAGGVRRVQVGFLAQPRVGHRAEVDLNERQQLPVLPIGEHDRRIGGERSLLARVLERLARLALPAVRPQGQPGGRCLGGDRDVQLGECGSVREEDRVGPFALPSPRYGVAAHQAVRSPCGPVVVGGGAVLAVGAAAPGQPEVVQAACAVAQGALGNVGEQPGELILSHHPVSAQHRK